MPIFYRRIMDGINQCEKRQMQTRQTPPTFRAHLLQLPEKCHYYSNCPNPKHEICGNNEESTEAGASEAKDRFQIINMINTTPEDIYSEDEFSFARCSFSSLPLDSLCPWFLPMWRPRVRLTPGESS